MVEIRRYVITQRIVDGLVLTFLVHVLPADIRLAPKQKEESQLLFALHPELRQKLMRVIIPIRAVDYLGLGTTAMIMHWDKWQCIALVFMFIVMHILLILVLRTNRPESLQHKRAVSTMDVSSSALVRRISSSTVSA